MNYNYLVGR